MHHAQANAMRRCFGKQLPPGPSDMQMDLQQLQLDGRISTPGVVSCLWRPALHRTDNGRLARPFRVESRSPAHAHRSPRPPARGYGSASARL
jgi:hypothetical protein